MRDLPQPLPRTRCCPSKTHSATQPHAPEHPPCGQPSPTTPADVGAELAQKRSYAYNRKQSWRDRVTQTSWSPNDVTIASHESHRTREFDNYPSSFQSCSGMAALAITRLLYFDLWLFTLCHCILKYVMCFYFICSYSQRLPWVSEKSWDFRIVLEMQDYDDFWAWTGCILYHEMAVSPLGMEGDIVIWHVPSSSIWTWSWADGAAWREFGALDMVPHW